jgi:hypothetical protein
VRQDEQRRHAGIQSSSIASLPLLLTYKVPTCPPASPSIVLYLALIGEGGEAIQACDSPLAARGRHTTAMYWVAEVSGASPPTPSHRHHRCQHNRYGCFLAYRLQCGQLRQLLVRRRPRPVLVLTPHAHSPRQPGVLPFVCSVSAPSVRPTLRWPGRGVGPPTCSACADVSALVGRVAVCVGVRG